MRPTLPPLLVSVLLAPSLAPAFPAEPDDATSAPDRRGPFRVACVGDSITAGARVEARTGSYPARLQAALGEAFRVRNFGRGGATLLRVGRPSVWSRLPEVLAWRPHVVVVALGTNDTCSGRRPNWERIEAFPGDYDALIESLAALPTGPRILVCTPTDMVLETPGLTPPRRADLAARRPRLLELCERVRELPARHRERNVALVELHRVLSGRPDLLTPGDGVHPNADGYLAIAKAIAPHVRSAVPRPEGGYLMRGPRRTREAIDAIYREMPPLRYEPPPTRWPRLPRTGQCIAEGRRLRVVLLGDSIVNDTARSGWSHLVASSCPKTRVEPVIAVRGSTGCVWYREGDRVRTYVLDHAPDLVLIGGISHGGDTGAIREVIRKIRAGSDADILLASGPFGRVDPLDDATWRSISDPPADSYRARLERLARETGCGWLDLQLEWARYVRGSGRPSSSFHRDPVHANAQGEQILGRILARFLTPDPAEGPARDQRAGSARDQASAAGSGSSVTTSESPSRSTGNRSTAFFAGPWTHRPE